MSETRTRTRSPHLVPFEALYDARRGMDAAISAAVAAYPAIACPTPGQGVLDELRRRLAQPLDRAVLILRAAAAAFDPLDALDASQGLPPVAVVSRPLVWRTLSEAYLGESLFEAVWGRPRRYATGTPCIDGACLSKGVVPEPGAHLNANRTVVEVLYLLARDGLTARFERIEAHADPLSVPPEATSW